MKHISINAANNLYIGMMHSYVHKHKAFHPVLKDFCLMISKIERELGEQAQDDFWKDLLGAIKRYRFLLYAAPLPINSNTTNLLSQVQDSIKKCRYYFPSSLSLVQDILDKLSILSTLNDNPLLDTITELISDYDFTGLLLKENYLFFAVEDELKKHPFLQDIELVNMHQLRGPRCYRNLLVIGPSYWYPEYVLSSPRAKNVHLIRYSWLTDRWKPNSFFQETYTQKKMSSNNSLDNVYEQDENEKIGLDEDIETGIFPEIQWENFTKKIMRQSLDDSNQERVSARLYLLADEKAVLLEANEDVKVHVLDLEVDEDDEEELRQAKHIALSKVRPGMFLVLRTEGGGDYIVPVADKILGAKAVSLRAKQEHWKTLLRQAVVANDIVTISIELLYKGSKRAKESNVRNWMSDRHIRPQDDEDFLAILRLVGLQDKEQEYWNAAKEIKSAHSRAGFYIRDQLLKRIANTDLQELHRKGFLNFELPKSDGGSLTAIRIEHISPETFDISASRLRRLLEVKNVL